MTEGESSRRSRLKVYTEAEQEWYRGCDKRHGDAVFLGPQFSVFIFRAARLWLFFCVHVSFRLQLQGLQG